jgi:hypothetical protein
MCRKEGEERGEKAGGVGFFCKQPRKTRENRQNMNYKKLGMEGGEVGRWGGGGGGTQNCIKDITGTTTVC